MSYDFYARLVKITYTYVRDKIWPIPKISDSIDISLDMTAHMHQREPASNILPKRTSDEADVIRLSEGMHNGSKQ